LEFIDQGAIKKNTTAIGIENEFLSMYQSYISASSILWGHVNMHSKILHALTKFKSFIKGFEINSNVKTIFSEGHFDPAADIQNPEALIGQIRNNISLYEPDEQGIRTDWNSISLDKIEELKNDILYVYIIGLKKSLWTNTDEPVELIPEYYGSADGIEMNSAVHLFDYRKPKMPTSFHELVSKEIIDYMHTIRGIDCNELTFSAKTDAIYSDLVINSESETFPWVAADFEEGKPIKQIDTLFNISPWAFPRNYFYDVCLENEYQRVVGVVLRRSQLTNIPIETIDSDISLDDIIGSIRWIVKGG
jgi:hypothetical protein